MGKYIKEEGTQLYKFHMVTRLLLCMMLVLSVVATVPVQAGAPSYYPGYPQGNVGVATPEIGMRVVTNGNVTNFANLLIDNQKVNVSYDPATERYFYIPDQPLSVGKHRVDIEIQFEGYVKLEKTWYFTVADQALATLPEPTAQHQLALQAANDYRLRMGLPLLEMNRSLNTAAVGHAQYLETNNVFSHYQESGKPGFFGENVLDRARYYGYGLSVYEDISKQYDRSPVYAIDGLFDAPYHRIPFMDPASVEFGYGQITLYHTLHFGIGASSGNQFVIYPVDGEQYVPRAWYGNEVPDPLRIHPNAEYPVGYPIMAGVYGPDVARVELVSASVKKSDGTDVPIYKNSVNGNPADNSVSREVILIPKKPLEANRTYTMQLSLKVHDFTGGTTTQNKTWSFTTESVEGEGKKRLHDTNSVINSPVIQQREALYQVNFTITSKLYTVNGKTFELDVAPFILDQRSYLPFRALGEALKATVDWDNSANAAIFTKDGTKIILYPGSGIVSVNGKFQKLENGAILRSGRTMVPVRFVSEVMGAKVDWDEVTRSVKVAY